MTTANLRLVPWNDHDDATLTPSATEVAGFEVENTQNTRRNSLLRTVDASAFSVTGVWSANRTVSHFSMWRHLNHSGSVRFQLFSDAAASVQVYDSGAVSCIPYTPSGAYTWSDGSTDPLQSSMPYYLWFAEQAARSYKISFSGTPGQAYWQASRFFIGRYYEFSINPKYGASLGIGDTSDQIRSQGGSLVTLLGESWPILDLQLDWLSEAEAVSVIDILQRALTARDVVASMFPGDGTSKEARHTVNGRFQALNSIGRPNPVALSTRFQIVGN